MSDTEQRGEKREKSDAESSDDDFVGPSITDAAPPKKKKVLEYEKVGFQKLSWIMEKKNEVVGFVVFHSSFSPISSSC